MNQPIDNNEEIIEFQNFVEKNPTIYKYLHNTPTEEIAKKILNEGFVFENHLHNTTDLVSGIDPVELKYFFIQRKNYGIYTIVIHIGRKIIDYYTEQLKSTRHYFYEVLSKHLPIKTSDDTIQFTLHEQFIKGYYNQKTRQIIINPNYNPHNNLTLFKDNLKNLLKQSKKH